MTIEEKWKTAFSQINFKNAIIIESSVIIKQNKTAIYNKIIFLSPKKAVIVLKNQEKVIKKVYKGNNAIDQINKIYDGLIPFSSHKLFNYDEEEKVYKSIGMFKDEFNLYSEVKIELFKEKIHSIEMRTENDLHKGWAKKALRFIY